MFLAIKDTKIISIHEVEWQCRRKAKGISKPEYWTWLESVTSGDPPLPDYSGEDYEVKEIEVDIQGFNQSGHIVTDIGGTYFHLKWVENDDGVFLESGDKLLLETGGKILDEVVVKGIVKDDDALAEYQLAEKWKQVRQDRDRFLNETDWIVTKAKETNTNIPSAWKTYRQALRDVPSQSDPDNITWPTKPS